MGRIVATSRGRRLAKAAKDVQARADARAQEASQERRGIIAGWRLYGLTPDQHPGLTEEEVDRRILLMAEETLYQYEHKHGPVRPLLPTPDLMAEEWGARTDAEVAGYAKGILMDGVTSEWKRPRAWLMTDPQTHPQGQKAEERQ